jgi:isocitrate dehydrogenase (NAD+)
MMLDYLKLHSYATSICKAFLAPMNNKDMHNIDIRGQGNPSHQDIICHICIIIGRAWRLMLSLGSSHS